MSHIDAKRFTIIANKMMDEGLMLDEELKEGLILAITQMRIIKYSKCWDSLNITHNTNTNYNIFKTLAHNTITQMRIKKYSKCWDSLNITHNTNTDYKIFKMLAHNTNNTNADYKIFKMLAQSQDKLLHRSYSTKLTRRQLEQNPQIVQGFETL